MEQLPLFNPDEEWRDVPGYEGFYKVSNLGRVMSLHTYNGLIPGRLLKQSRSGDGTRLLVNLKIRGHRRTFNVYKLVAVAFIGPRPDGLEINHIDGNPSNNNLKNLEYISHLENVQHCMRLGKHRNGKPGLTPENVIEIRRRARTGETRASIAKSFGVSTSTINDVCWGRTFKSIPLDKPIMTRRPDSRRRNKKTS